MMNEKTANLTLFASGSGSNVENIVNYSRDVQCSYSVNMIMCNKPEAYVLKRAERLGIPSLVFTARNLRENTIAVDGETLVFTDYLHSIHTECIVLAGFLLKIPEYLLKIYKGRILNIHPALLPAYGGRGMYGEHVHQAVIANREKVSGITIHVIDENYDQGKTLFQSRCEIAETDTPEILAAKIHELERIYPTIINDYIKKTF